MVFNRAQAVARAKAEKTNEPGTCQLWTRTIFGVQSAGDRDHDGDADAVDGWLSEPPAHRHVGDRKPPEGVPLSFAGGSRGFGHRAVSIGNGHLRSTDMFGGRYFPGRVGTCTIADIEREMNQTYLGWSNTITGVLIPMPPPKPTIDPPSRGSRVDTALAKLLVARKHAKNPTRIAILDRAIKVITRIPKV